MGVFRHLLDLFYFISSGVRFAMVMISDDSGKTPLTFCGFYQFHSWEYFHWNVLGLCSRGRNRALWLDQDKKIASGKPLNPCRWPAGGKTLDSPAFLANEWVKSLIIAEGKIAAFCRCGKNAVSINWALYEFFCTFLKPCTCVKKKWHGAETCYYVINIVSENTS